MKKLILLFFLFSGMISFGQPQQTGGNLTIFSEDGDAFYVVLNGEKQNDEGLSQQIKNRVLLIRNKYDEKGAKCEIHLLESGGSYSKKIIQYVTNNAINVIALAYHSESLLPQFDTFAQSLITNEAQLPCMIVASKPAGNLYF